jgi:N6-L-threonylcarbamoyladenine synthase
MKQTKQKIPIILAIDTSCDDTAVALVQGKVVLSNIVASQVELHKQYGGVFPTVAKQAHQENIESTMKLALKRAKLGSGLDGDGWQKINAVAVTAGPGLAPALEIGIIWAKKWAQEYKKPLIAVNHIEGHLLSVLAQKNSRIGTKLDAKKLQKNEKINFPVLGIVVSGGHTDFILIKKIGKYERIGFSIDDAAGECLDKIGRMLGLGYPAGAIIEEFAKKGDENKYKFPLPMTASRDFNMSFSGLKTFARNLIAKIEKENGGSLDKQMIYDFSASTQKGVFRHIIHKLEKALVENKVGELWLGGGVSANMTLRKLLRFVANKNGLKFKAPYHKKLSGDNAAMIGVVAGFKFERGEVEKDLEKVERKPRWRIGEK